MDDDDQLETLLAGLEVAVTADKRVAALQSIQTYIEGADDVLHTDQLTASLKVQLKNQNHLVSSLALSILPTYVAKVASSKQSTKAHNVKVVLHATLSTVLEKLGDQKEKIREEARLTVVEMAKAAFAVSPSGSTLAKDGHTAVAMFEKVFKEAGLASKIAKVKEQSTLVLIPLREEIEKFPLRPFLPSLVEQLSDADQGVREAARTACIGLFSNATPIAKSDLKKELEKKAVRKQTADAILAEVLGGASANIVEAKATTSSTAETHFTERPHYDGEQATAPAARSVSRLGGGGGAAAADSGDDSVKPVYIASQWDLERTMSAMLPYFEGKETEHNWLTREQSIVKMRGMLKTGVHESFREGFFAAIKQIHEGILKATASLRTTLSMHGLQLITELAQNMREDLDGLAETFVTSLVKMAGFTKKIVANASQKAVQSILRYVSYRHKLLELIWQTLHDKTVATRGFMCGHLITILETHGKLHKHAIEGHGGLEIIEKFCKKALPDQNPDVREKARTALYKIETIWPAVGVSIVDSLDAAIRKQVESNRGKTPATSALPSTPQAKFAPARARTPATGPSHAILAAKRAAAAKLAQERRDRQEAEASTPLHMDARGEEDEDEDEEGTEPSSPPSNGSEVDKPKRRCEPCVAQSRSSLYESYCQQSQSPQQQSCQY
ncbi:hypothetical protein CBS101457_005975 [Exobasidium rhododendri]|nr:hypothetical protein CBS101457_005975 [Exobasidium rhododendri]